MPWCPCPSKNEAYRPAPPLLVHPSATTFYSLGRFEWLFDFNGLLGKKKEVCDWQGGKTQDVKSIWLWPWM